MTQAFIRVNFHVLGELLRLPPGVRITAADTEAHAVYPEDAQCVLTIDGYGVPAEGELVAEYLTENTTIVKFKGFRPV